MHHSGNPVGIKSTLEQHLPKKGPMDGVISFVEVDLKEHSAEMLALHLMDNIMENEDPIQNIPAFREGRLVWVMDPGGD